MLTVFTVAIGDTDRVQAPSVIDPRAHYVCFSDRPCPLPYRWVLIPSATDGTLPARRVKVLSDHPLLDHAAWTLYHDASYRLTSDLQWVRDGLETADVVALLHGKRQRIEDEAAVVAKYGYVTPADGQALVETYRRAGYRAETMTSGGLLGRRNTPAVQRFNRRWWTEVERWRGRDQVSLDYAAWLTDIRIQHVPGVVRENPYAAWRQAVPA